MSKIQWFFLWLMFIGYLFLGATMFYFIERGLEEKRRSEILNERNNIYGLLLEHYKNSSYEHHFILDRLTEYCGKSFTLATNLSINLEEPYTWSFYNSFFFSLTTLSTIGYGNISPSSEHGRVLVVLYGLIGVPFCGIVMVQLGEFFSSVFLKAHLRYKSQTYESRMALVFDIILYLVPGLMIIIIVPALMFAYFEQWTLIQSVYYAFVTLTTIGFGDFVAGQKSDLSVSYAVYKVILVIWVMFGLGYLVMLLGFIARGLKSKKINRLEHKLANTIKQTQSKIWNEFIGEVAFVRRLLNEMHLSKVKPVYRKKSIQRSLPGRSQSCPNLSEWPLLESFKSDGSDENIEELGDLIHPQPKRRRCFSENIDAPKLHRVLSESHLSMIDRNETFKQSDQIHTKEMLNKVIDDIVIPQEEEYGYLMGSNTGLQGFSDEEILASEDYSTKTSNSGWTIPNMRSRAFSEAPTPYHTQKVYSVQKTWTGDDHIRSILLDHLRSRSASMIPTDSSVCFKPLLKPKPKVTSESKIRRMSVAAKNILSLNNIAQKWKRKALKVDKEPIMEYDENIKNMNKKNIDNLIQTKRKKSVFSFSNYNKETYDDDLNSAAKYLSDRRPSILDAFINSSVVNDGTNMISPIFEKTSVADFIRVMSSIQTLQKNFDTYTKQQNDIKNTKESPLFSLFANTPNQTTKPHRRMSKAEIRASLTALDGNKKKLKINNMNRRFSQVPDPIFTITSTNSDTNNFNRKRSASVFQSRLSADKTNWPPVNKRLHQLLPKDKSKKTISSTKISNPTVIITSPDGHHKFSVQSTDLSQLPSIASNVSTDPGTSKARTKKDSLCEVIIER